MVIGQDQLAHSLLEAMSEALYLVDRSRTITYWNSAAEQLTGFAAADVISHRCRDGILNHVDEDGALLCGARCPLLRTMRDGKVREMVAYTHHRDGHRLPVAVRAAPLRDADGSICGAVEVFHDDSRSRDLACQVADAEKQALTDQLTGIDNRRMLERHLLRLSDDRDRYARLFAVVFLDVDRFKSVNDTYGHQAGDELLRCVAATLRDCTRPGDMVGRWGGEEFLVLAQVADLAEARSLAERVRRMVARSWLDVEGSQIGVTVSAGVALLRPAEPPEQVVNRADAAMIAAKAEGRGPEPDGRRWLTVLRTSIWPARSPERCLA